MLPIWFDLVTQNPSPHRNILFTQYFMHYRISSNKTLFAIFLVLYLLCCCFFLFSKCKGRFVPFISWNFNAPYIAFSELAKHITRYDSFLEIQWKVKICQNEPWLEKKRNKCSEKIHFKLQQISEKRLLFFSFYTYIVLLSSVWMV